jgi:hypothetical protein
MFARSLGLDPVSLGKLSPQMSRADAWSTAVHALERAVDLHRPLITRQGRFYPHSTVIY